MCSQGIDRLGALADQQIARAVLHQLALLLGRLDAHKAHGWAPDRLADRLGVSCVVLIALEIGLHVLRRHQTNLVSELGQLASPIVGCGTGLHPDQAWRQRCEERDHLAAPQLLSDNDLLSCIDAMNLEYLLGDIQTDRGNLHVDGSLGDSVATITLWQFVAGSGRRPPHQKQTDERPLYPPRADILRVNEYTPCSPDCPRILRSRVASRAI